MDAAAALLQPAGWEVTGVETGSSDATYAWREESSMEGRSWRRHTVFPGEAAERIPAPRLRAGFRSALDQLRPDAMAIAGWATPDAHACLAWCRKNGAKAIVMSETREADGKRVWWKEFVKSRFVRRFDGALVGGKSHRDYLVKLGMPPDTIHFGYNVVDNAYFARAGGCPVRPEGADSTGRPYFLASNRFIERKNLARLLEAYGAYVHSAEFAGDRRAPWDLCLLGDGELKADLVDRCHGLGLDVAACAPWEEGARPDQGGPVVCFPGFRQIEELPRFYARAGCLVHPALAEPWGLVINEAMACGLPVLSSRNVGAAEELVEDGVNGWRFNPTEVGEIRDCLLRVSSPDFDAAGFAAASRRLLSERAPLTAFAKGLRQALPGVHSTSGA